MHCIVRGSIHNEHEGMMSIRAFFESGLQKGVFCEMIAEGCRERNIATENCLQAAADRADDGARANNDAAHHADIFHDSVAGL